jgi:PKD repeat protein
MSRDYTRLLLCALVFPLLAWLCAACSGSSGELAVDAPPVSTAPVQAATGLAVPFPADTLQPWELAGHSPSAITPDSEFVPGVERFSDSGQAAENGEALRLEGGVPGGGNLAYALYRMELAGFQPGVVSVDVNLLDGPTLERGYYLALADYSRTSWDWHGPFRDHHVRISTGPDLRRGAVYTSGLGNTFICVAAWDGARIDVVGVGLERFDDADVEPPPAPAGLTATPVAGGVELRWLAAEADDLAGYMVCWRGTPFEFPDSTGVQRLDYLCGDTRCTVTGLSGDAILRVAAVDFSGNLSPLSNDVLAVPLAGSAPQVLLSTESPSGLLHTGISLTASGAEIYDWDLDGDGVFDDVTGDTTGIQLADTSASGIIRPAVRGIDGSEESTACGAVSLLIHGNARPVAVGYAHPAAGEAPHTVAFSAEAEDADGFIFAGGWDFDGDGVYDTWSEEGDLSALNPPDHEFAEPGIYNAKLRVVDDGEAWDVDTVTVLVSPPGLPENEPPDASLVAGPLSGAPPLTVTFDGSASSDPDGYILRFDWDFDNDGVWDAYDGFDVINWTYEEEGFYTARMRVTDNRGGQGESAIQVSVEYPPNDPPTASLSADFPDGTPPHMVSFSAAGSFDPDGSIVLYQWDVNGDGAFEQEGTQSSIQHTYIRPGLVDALVQVTDNRGGTDTATVQLRIHGWRTQTVASGGESGDGCWLLEISGKPSIGYWHDDGSTMQLRFIHSSDDYGRTWGAPVQLFEAQITGTILFTDLDVINDLPAACFVDDILTPNKLWYRQATDAAGTSWSAATQVLQVTGGIADASLEEVDSRPAIAYFDWTNAPDNELKFIRASNGTGSAWGSPVTVRSASGFRGNDCCMATIGDYPAIVYSNGITKQLEYNYSLQLDGSTWVSGYESLGTTGIEPSLREILYLTDPVPLVSFATASDLDFYVVKGYNSTGTTWYTAQLIDDAPTSGIGSSIAYDGSSSLHAYVFYLRSGYRVWCAASQSLTSETYWLAPQPIDAESQASYQTSGVILNDSPAVAYYDWQDDAVRFAYLY